MAPGSSARDLFGAWFGARSDRADHRGLLVSDEWYPTSGMRRETLYNPRRPVTMADGGGWYAFRFQVELRMDSTRAV